MTIKPRTIEPTPYGEDQRDRVVRPLSRYTSSPMFQGWGPKL
jgi:hypothetical protein